MRFLLLLLVPGLPVIVGGCATTSTPPEWHLIDEGGFAFRAPPDLLKQHVRNIDPPHGPPYMYFSGSGMQVFFDYNDGPCDRRIFKWNERGDYRIEPLRVSDLPGVLGVGRKYSDGFGVILLVNIPRTDSQRASCLSFSAGCLTKQEQEAAIRMLRTLVVRPAALPSAKRWRKN